MHIYIIHLNQFKDKGRLTFEKENSHYKSIVSLYIIKKGGRPSFYSMPDIDSPDLMSPYAIVDIAYMSIGRIVL